MTLSEIWSSMQWVGKRGCKWNKWRASFKIFVPSNRVSMTSTQQSYVICIRTCYSQEFRIMCLHNHDGLKRIPIYEWMTSEKSCFFIICYALLYKSWLTRVIRQFLCEVDLTRQNLYIC